MQNIFLGATCFVGARWSRRNDTFGLLVGKVGVGKLGVGEMALHRCGHYLHDLLQIVG